MRLSKVTWSRKESVRQKWHAHRDDCFTFWPRHTASATESPLWTSSPIICFSFFFFNAALHTHLSVSSRWIRGGVLIQLGGELLRATNTTHISHTPFTLREFSDRFLTAFWHLQPSKIWDTILCDLKEAWYRRPGGACRHAQSQSDSSEKDGGL